MRGGFPASHPIADIAKPPYNANGAGKADDTDAIQRALSDVRGLHQVAFLPGETQLAVDDDHWSKKDVALPIANRKGKAQFRCQTSWKSEMFAGSALA